MEAEPNSEKLDRLQALTFKLNDFLEKADWKVISNEPGFEIRRRAEILSDGRIIFGRQFRDRDRETLIGCKVSIRDYSGGIITTETAAVWEPTMDEEQVAGIDLIEPALEEVVNLNETS